MVTTALINAVSENWFAENGGGSDAYCGLRALRLPISWASYTLIASLCRSLVSLWQDKSFHTYFQDPIDGLIISVASVKPKSHQELPFRVALDDDLLCGHGTRVLSARWQGAMLPATLIRLMFQRLWMYNDRGREGGRRRMSV